MTRAPNFDEATLAAVREKLCKWARWVRWAYTIGDVEARQWLHAANALEETAAKQEKDEDVKAVNAALADLGRVHANAQVVVLSEYLFSGNQHDRAANAYYSHARYRTLLEGGILYLAGRLTANKNPKVEII